jgi:hypothetical protein
MRSSRPALEEKEAHANNVVVTLALTVLESTTQHMIKHTTA